jgi:hypothetical protein
MVLLPGAASGQRVLQFEDLALAPESFYNGSNEAGGFTSGGASFNNSYTAAWGSWSGWSYSNVTDNTTGGFGNQYAAITGGGLGPNGIYGVAYTGTPRIVLPANETVLSLQITNTAYAYFSMLEGDSFSKQFQSADDDFLKLTISGLDGAENVVGSVDFFLADFRHDDGSLDYIVDQWTSVDLTTFGPTARMLDFSLTSSDVGAFGMNTPAYFALGEITVIPEPTTYALWGGLATGLALWIRRGKGRRGGRLAPGMSRRR